MDNVQPFSPTKTYLSSEVKQVLRISKRTLTLLIKQGRITPIKIHPNFYRFSGSQLNEFLKDSMS